MRSRTLTHFCRVVYHQYGGIIPFSLIVKGLWDKLSLILHCFIACRILEKCVRNIFLPPTLWSFMIYNNASCNYKSVSLFISKFDL